MLLKISKKQIKEENRLFSDEETRDSIFETELKLIEFGKEYGKDYFEKQRGYFNKDINMSELNSIELIKQFNNIPDVGFCPNRKNFDYERKKNGISDDYIKNIVKNHPDCNMTDKIDLKKQNLCESYNEILKKKIFFKPWAESSIESYINEFNKQIPILKQDIKEEIFENSLIKSVDLSEENEIIEIKTKNIKKKIKEKT